MGYLDIIIFAAIAGFLAYRIYVVLGQKRDDEPQRENRFARKPPAPDDSSPPPGQLPGNLGQRPPAENEGEIDLSPYDNTAPRLAPASAAPGSLVGILAQLRQLDAQFNEKDFLAGAKIAFAMIVQAFAKGDKPVLQKHVSGRVFAQFARVIDQRQAAGQTQETNFAGPVLAELIAARLEGGKAFITVRYESQQKNVVRDSAGNVVSGDVRKPDDVIDQWTFTRDLKASDPNWLLVETQA